MMKDYFVLTYSRESDKPDAIKDFLNTIANMYPNKNIIAIPDSMTFKNYNKEELLEILNFLKEQVERLINE